MLLTSAFSKQNSAISLEEWVLVFTVFTTATRRLRVNQLLHFFFFFFFFFFLPAGHTICFIGTPETRRISLRSRSLLLRSEIGQTLLTPNAVYHTTPQKLSPRTARSTKHHYFTLILYSEGIESFFYIVSACEDRYLTKKTNKQTNKQKSANYCSNTTLGLEL